MQKNLLVTGPPGCGKTTVLLRLSKLISDRGYVVGGVICPEIKRGGVRQGFEIVDFLGRRGVLAHVSLARGDAPMISKYGVNLKDLEQISHEAFARKADVFIVDEIGPMELKSSAFAHEVRGIFESKQPVAAAVHFRTSADFIDIVKRRIDTKTIIVTPQNRDELPNLMCEELLRYLEATGR